MMESLKEDSLMEDEAHSLRGAGDRHRRQGNFSARVILMNYVTTGKTAMLLLLVHDYRECWNDKNVMILIKIIYLYLLCMIA